jgi:hypothetical protein
LPNLVHHGINIGNTKRKSYRFRYNH